jgi:hypothetical protein
LTGKLAGGRRSGLPNGGGDFAVATAVRVKRLSRTPQLFSFKVRELHLALGCRALSAEIAKTVFMN